MQQQNVKIIGLQTLQTAFHRAHNMLVGKIVTLRVRWVRVTRKADAAFGLKDAARCGLRRVFLTASAKTISDLPTAVNIRVVEKVDAAIQRTLDDLRRFGAVCIRQGTIVHVPPICIQP